jgi:hypothetical protein
VLAELVIDATRDGIPDVLLLTYDGAIKAAVGER